MIDLGIKVNTLLTEVVCACNPGTDHFAFPFADSLTLHPYLILLM